MTRKYIGVENYAPGLETVMNDSLDDMVAKYMGDPATRRRYEQGCAYLVYRVRDLHVYRDTLDMEDLAKATPIEHEAFMFGMMQAATQLVFKFLELRDNEDDEEDEDDDGDEVKDKDGVYS